MCDDGTVTEQSDDPALDVPDDIDGFKQARWPWVVGVAAVLLIGICTGLYVGLIRPPEIHADRVLIAASGPGAKAVANDLAKRLQEHGFVTIPGPNPDEPDGAPLTSTYDVGLKEAKSAARKHGAGAVIYVTIAITSQRAGLSSTSRFLSAEAVTQVHETETEHQAAEHTIGFATESKTQEAAIATMVAAFAEAALPKAVDDLLASPAMKNFVSDKSNLEGHINAARFKGTLNKQRLRTEAQKKFDDQCQRATDELAALKKQGISCITAGCDEEYLSGLNADGTAALVRVESGTPLYTFDFEPKLLRFETPDRLELVRLADNKRRTIALAQNLYTYPLLSANGRMAVFVEKAGGRYGVVTVDLQSGTRVVLDSAAYPAQVQNAKISSDGSLVFYYWRKSKHGQGTLMSIPSGGGKPIGIADIPRDADWVDVQLEGQTKPLPVIAVISDKPLPTDAPNDARPDDAQQKATSGSNKWIALYHPKKSDAAPLRVIADADRHIDQIAGSRANKLYVTYRTRAECGVGVYDVAQDELAFQRTEVCIKDPGVRSDGYIVGEGYPSGRGAGKLTSSEIVAVNPADGTLQQLTRTPLRDRYVRLPLQGKRAAFEYLGMSDHSSFPRVAVCYRD